MAEEIWITPADHTLIGSDDDSRWRIETVWQFVEWNKAVPFAAVSGTVVRHTAIAAFANRNAARAVIADVAINVRIDKVLGGPAVMAQGGGEFFPVARPVGFKQPS